MNSTTLLRLAFLSLVVGCVHAGEAPGTTREIPTQASRKSDRKSSASDPKVKQTIETYREYLASHFPTVSTTGAATTFKMPADVSDEALRGKTLRMVSGTVEPTDRKNEVTVKTRDGREIPLKVTDFSEWLTDDGKATPLFDQAEKLTGPDSELGKSGNYLFVFANGKLYQAAKDDSPIALPEPGWPKKPKPQPQPQPTPTTTQPKGGTPTKG